MNNKLLLAFYVPYEMLLNNDEDGFKWQIAEYLDNILGDNQAALFFLPTEGEMRVECLNPVVLNEEQFKEYDKIITDIKNSEKFNDYKGEQTDN